MPRRSTRLLAALLALAVGLPSPLALASYSISCASNGGRYQYCSANTEGSVRLTSVQSQRPCNQGRDWGYDGGGVWVANGCRATFEVGRGGGGGSKNDVGAAIAIAGGLAILGAMIANSNSNSSNTNGNNYYDNRDQWANGPNVPGWMIGRFSGRNSGNGSPETISIDPHGNAWLQWPGGQRVNGMAGGNSLSFPDGARSVQPARGGILVDGAFYSRS